MRKLLLFITILFLLSCNSANPNKIWTLKYIVFYPNYNDTIIISGHHSYFWNSDRGSNYIKESSITGPDVYHGSAPYKILQYTIEKVKK